MSQHMLKNGLPQPVREPIAIVGIGCRLPGGADSPARLWDLLCQGFDAIEPIPSDRFDVDGLYDERPATPGRIMSRWGGFLKGIDHFDAEFFGMSPREAERLDPQQRLLLETTWEATEDAGLTSDQLSGSNTGVFVGMWLNDFEGRLFANPDQIDFYMTTGSGRYSASGRLSYILDLFGPSITIDTACSSSLVAVHLACQSIWSGECALALAGGANVILQPHITIAYSQSRMMAADGHCKFGDASANGYVRSDGAAMVLLKPLSAALADENPVYAVIRGSAVTNDGRSSGFLATPGQAGQEEMLRRAYKHAGIDPRMVRYVEAHGTGTAAGDPVELGALGAVLGADRPVDQPCLVGSIKTNIGHTEGAAGVTGMIKAALALKHRVIPASLHVREPNPNIPWDVLRLQVCTEQRPWPAADYPAIAGVSSFGIAGTNAHIVLEAPPAPHPPATENTDHGPLLLPISAHTPEALLALAGSYRLLLDTDQLSLAALCSSAGIARNHYRHRLAVVARDRAELVEALDCFLRGAAHPALVRGQTIEETPKIAFVFPGQGAQWFGMARELLVSNPVFRASIERCERAMAPFVSWSLSDQLLHKEQEIVEIDILQPALFAIQVALAAVWRSWGVEPAAVIGHSMGEVAAAYIAGILTLEDAARVMCLRSKLLLRIRGQGAMAVVNLSLQDTLKLMADHQDSIAVAVSNSPRSTVLSGDPTTLEQLLEELRARNIFCRMIKVDVASHSPQVDVLLPELLSALDGLAPETGSVPFYSTVSGEVTHGEADRIALGPAYWVANLRQPVRFGEMVARLAADGCTTFIELSTHPILRTPIEETLQHQARTGQTLPSLQRNVGERLSMLGSLGSLYTLGLTPRWQELFPATRLLTGLPTYPWQRRRHWLSQTTPSQTQAAHAPTDGSLLGRRIPPVALLPDTQIWENTLAFDAIQPVLRQPLADAEILAGGLYAWLGLQAAALSFDTNHVRLSQLSIRRDLILTEGSSATMQVALASDHTRLHIYGRTDDAESWVEYATGQLAADSEREPETLDLLALQARCATPGALPGLTALHLGDGEALARFEHPRNEGNTGEALEFVTGLRLLCALGSAAASGIEWVLSEVEHIRLDKGATPAWAYARLVEHNAESCTGDVSLLDLDGQVVATAYGVRLAAPAPELLESIAQSRATRWLYELAWRQLAPTQIQTRASRPSRMLIFADQAGLGAELARQLADQGGTPILVYPGASFGSAADGSYTVEPASAGDMSRLLDEVRTTHSEQWDAAVYLWGLDQAAAEGLSGPELLVRQQLVTGGALLLCQSLINATGRGTRLWLVTRSAVMVDGQLTAVEQATLWGLGRVIANEHPKHWGGLIDLDQETAGRDATQLLEALQAGDGEDQIAIRDGNRFGTRLVRAHFDADVPPSLRADATYLITGGLGGIGLAIARWMLANGARHLAMVGRRSLNQTAMVTLRSLEDAGAHIVYLQTDVSKQDQLAHALSRITQQMPPLRGVIHTAGVLADAALLRQNWHGFEEVMAGKLIGAWNLHQQTIGLDLDLFVLCSSVSAVLGLPGQANYAAANTFLDSLAQLRQRQGLPALSINWGPWDEIGLAAQGERGARLLRRGLVALPPTAAAAVFGRLLHHQSAQITVAEINWATLLEQTARGITIPLFSEQAQTITVAAPQPSATQSSLHIRLGQSPLDDRYAILLEYIQERVAAVLRFESAAQVLQSQGFFQLGMDSLTALELKNHLSEALGLLLPANLVFDYPTAATLARHLLSLIFPTVSPDTAIQSEARADLAALDEITRDDLKALLDAELDAIDL